jgi:hypothetical protein
MVDKLIVTRDGVAEQNFTPEEIAQRAYEASLPPVIPPKTELELLKEQVTETQGAIDFILMNF